MYLIRVHHEIVRKDITSEGAAVKLVAQVYGDMENTVTVEEKLPGKRPIVRLKWVKGERVM